MTTAKPENVRVIAYYLPQFHPIPENDEWWGKGFTEWVNVAKARPQFPGHYQPHLPADLGFYDLRVPETRQAQADLAREYGIHGFCYYHYWYDGRQLLDRPLREVLESGQPDFPFCICWANQSWTRSWYGDESEVLIASEYSREQDLRHFHDLLPYLRDPRYITVDRKPLLSIYRVDELPNPAETAELWRREAVKAGLPGLYLCHVMANGSIDPDPERYGTDAAIARNTSWRGIPWRVASAGRIFPRLGSRPDPYALHNVHRYQEMVAAGIYEWSPSHRVFPCVAPGWDNTPRRRFGATIYIDSSPDLYRVWLRHALHQSCERFSGQERLVFVNAWNEWAEGAHLEPDARWGHAYLQATRDVIADHIHLTMPRDGGPVQSAVPTELSQIGKAYVQATAAQVAALHGKSETAGEHLVAAIALYPPIAQHVSLAGQVLNLALALPGRPWSERRALADTVFGKLRDAGVPVRRASRTARAALALNHALSAYQEGTRSALAEPLMTALICSPANLGNGGVVSMLGTLILGDRAKGCLLRLAGRRA